MMNFWEMYRRRRPKSGAYHLFGARGKEKQASREEVDGKDKVKNKVKVKDKDKVKDKYSNANNVNKCIVYF